MAMKMTLIKKAADKRHVSDIDTLLQECTCQIDPAVHAIGVGGQTSGLFELAQQGIRIGPQFFSHLRQGEVVIQVVLQSPPKAVDMPGGVIGRTPRATTSSENLFGQTGQDLLFFHQQGGTHQTGHRFDVEAMERCIFKEMGVDRMKSFHLPARLLYLEAPVGLQIKHGVTAGLEWAGITAVKRFRVDQGQSTRPEVDVLFFNAVANTSMLYGTNAETAVHMGLEEPLAAL